MDSVWGINRPRRRRTCWDGLKRGDRGRGREREKRMNRGGFGRMRWDGERGFVGVVVVIVVVVWIVSIIISVVSIVIIIFIIISIALKHKMHMCECIHLSKYKKIYHISIECVC